MSLAFVWGETPALPCLIDVIVGLPRPQTARDILRECTSLGIAALHFARTDKAEAAYAASSLWRSGEWRRCVINGAAQAFSTHLPVVTHGRSLDEIVTALPAAGARLALDNYEGSAHLGAVDLGAARRGVLALGAERGWSNGERDWLRAHGFTLVHLGPRVLRTETACIAAITLLQVRLELA